MSNRTRRVPVYLPNGVPTPHRASTSFATLLVADQAATVIDPTNLRAGILLTCPEPWAAVKQRYRAVVVAAAAMAASAETSQRSTAVHALLPSSEPLNLDLSYPAAFQETNGARLRRELWNRHLVPALA